MIVEGERPRHDLGAGAVRRGPVLPGRSPYAAVDRDPATQWVSGRDTGSAPWLEIRLERPTVVGEVRVTLGDAVPQDSVVRVTTDAGESEPRTLEPGGTATVTVPEGPTDGVRVEGVAGSGLALADVDVTEGPVSVSREEGSRFVGVSANVRGRDVASFVGDVQAAITRDVDLPAGYRVDYGGAFENLQAASARLMVVVPAALLLIFLLLYQTFGSIRLGLIIYLCVPMAVIGGVAALYLAGPDSSFVTGQTMVVDGGRQFI